MPLYNADPLKAQEEVGSYIKGKIVACKIVLMIHMTNTFGFQLESSKSKFVMIIEETGLCMTCLE